MQKFGLIGYPLVHSYSPQIHKLIYKLNNIEASYSLLELAPEKLNQNPLKNIDKDYCGINITIPYKTVIMQFLDEIDSQANQIGAVNTIKKVDNKWVGYNTDVDGFCYPIKDHYSKINRCLIIGTGGAAKAVVYAVLKYILPQNLVILGRNIDKTNELKNEYTATSESILIETNSISKIKNYLNGADLIVNTTSVGMHPKINNSILPESFSLKQKAIVYDIIYNPVETNFLKRAKEISPNCTTINGIQMLIAQAVKAVEIWTGKTISVENTIKALDESGISL